MTPYITREVVFRFRGMDFNLALSQGLFSSADIDAGSRFLLKVLSRLWDDALHRGVPLPRTVLDAGCGVGVLGICAARALAALSGQAPAETASGGSGLYIRAQDRDELARSFTVYNAARNGVPPGVLQAHTEPLLENCGSGPILRWDLILSNIPAKAGRPVLLDFISRSAARLTPGGLTALVAVNSLAALLRTRIGELGLPMVHDETGAEHTVLVYGPPCAGTNPEADRIDAAEGVPPGTTGFLRQWPAYFRVTGDHEMEGIPYHIDAFQGVADFDTPSGAVQAAAKLISRLNPKPPAGAVLIHEPDQGHFPVWLLRRLQGGSPGNPPVQAITGPLVFSGRNILALEASRHNTLHALAAAAGAGCVLGTGAPEIMLIPAIDLSMDRERLGAAAGTGRYGYIAAFPPLVPQTDRLDAYWAGLAALLAPGGMALIALPSSLAERFDRKKPKGFTRQGDIKRQGFRALGYGYSD